MAIQFNDNIQNNTPKALEAKGSNFTGGRSKPFTSVALAHSAYSNAIRNEIDIIWVYIGGVATPHQYVGGYTEGNLIPCPWINNSVNSAGLIQFAATKAAADALTLTEGQMIRVAVDETNNGDKSMYLVLEDLSLEFQYTIA